MVPFPVTLNSKRETTIYLAVTVFNCNLRNECCMKILLYLILNSEKTWTILFDFCHSLFKSSRVSLY